MQLKSALFAISKKDGIVEVHVHKKYEYYILGNFKKKSRHFDTGPISPEWQFWRASDCTTLVSRTTPGGWAVFPRGRMQIYHGDDRINTDERVTSSHPLLPSHIAEHSTVISGYNRQQIRLKYISASACWHHCLRNELEWSAEICDHAGETVRLQIADFRSMYVSNTGLLRWSWRLEFGSAPKKSLNIFRIPFWRSSQKNDKLGRWELC